MKISVFMEHIFDAAQQENCSIDKIMSQVYSYGIHGVELDYERIKSDPLLISEIRKNGLDIACVYAFFDFSHNTDMNYAETVISTLSDNGIKRLMAIPGFIEETDNYELCKNQMLSCMNNLSALAAEHEIALCLEDFDDKKAVFSTTAGLLLFIENVDNLSCVFDTGNFIYSAEKECDAFEQLKEHVSHVHCKDRSTDIKEGEVPKMTISDIPLYSSPVGYGIIKIEEIVKELVKNGYDGWFAIEHFGSQAQLSDMKKSAEKLKEWFDDTSNCME